MVECTQPLGRILWQANMSIGVTLTNFGQCISMTLMSKKMQPILVDVRTIV